MKNIEAPVQPAHNRWGYNKAELEDLYSNRKWSILTIAKHLNSGFKAVRNALLREKIPLRKRNTIDLHRHSDETKAKIAKAHSGEKNHNYGKAWTTYSWVGKRHGISTINKMSNTRTVKGLSKGSLNPMSRPEVVKKWAAANRLKPNKQEIKVQAILDSLFPNKFFINVQGKVIVGSKIPDFVNETDKKLVEFYGSYWHRNDNEQDRIDYFKSFGYDCLIIWEPELKKEAEVIDKIRAFVGGSK